MKFVIERKGQNFLIVNDTTGVTRGVFKTEGEAKVVQQRLQGDHNDGVRMASAKMYDGRHDISTEG